MARIVISMAGEGRGHASRIKTITEWLRHRHQVWLYAPGEAYDFLKKCYAHERPSSNVTLQYIPGVRFQYTQSKLDLVKSFSHAVRFAAHVLPRAVYDLKNQLRQIQPNLVLCDFEPLLPRAASKLNIPIIAIDHQQTLRFCDWRHLPSSLRWYAWGMAWGVWWCYPRCTVAIVSAFFPQHLRQSLPPVKIIPVGPILRPQIMGQQPSFEDYYLSYLRPNTSDAVLDVLQEISLPVKVYGLGGRPRRSKLSFHALDDESFARDLASCRGVIGAAGNQLLGEAIYLGKPVLALPESAHYEQRINAHCLMMMGVGMFCELEQVSPAIITEYERRWTEYRDNLKPYELKWCGNHAVRKTLEHYLPDMTNGLAGLS